MKKKWKVFGSSLLGLMILGAVGFAMEYHQIQPTNHFKNIPVVDAGKSKPADNTFNILIMGSDQRPGETLGHSDTMLLMHVDLNKNQINTVSIPRDTRVHLDGYGYTKLTSVQYIMEAKNGPKQGIEEAVHAKVSTTKLTDIFNG